MFDIGYQFVESLPERLVNILREEFDIYCAESGRDRECEIEEEEFFTWVGKNKAGLTSLLNFYL